LKNSQINRNVLCRRPRFFLQQKNGTRLPAERRPARLQAGMTRILRIKADFFLPEEFLSLPPASFFPVPFSFRSPVPFPSLVPFFPVANP
jgi:hypothetical protein